MYFATSLLIISFLQSSVSFNTVSNFFSNRMMHDSFDKTLNELLDKRNTNRDYSISKKYHQAYLQRLKNSNISDENPFFNNREFVEDGEDDYGNEDEEYDPIQKLLKQQQKINNGDLYNQRLKKENDPSRFRNMQRQTGLQIIIGGSEFQNGGTRGSNGLEGDDKDTFKGKFDKEKSSLNFKDVGGYENIKQELLQVVDILSNYQVYSNYSVRVPKGLILEGPPGNGKTLLAKALSGEINVSFIPVSGSEFQEKYVGVGASRIRELFKKASKSKPCIVYIDEIDALGRERSADGESSSSERDSTLNELLIALDGFKSSSGVFVIGSTNRADLLDKALVRPGRIDKKIYIGNPDQSTRNSILQIHLHKKSYENDVSLDILTDLSNGLSGAQIENLLNEAMLKALREKRFAFNMNDIEFVLSRNIAGWQPNEHEFSENLVHRIAIHEMGHTLLGLLAKNYAEVEKVLINLSSPKSPGYTVFSPTTDSIFTKEALEDRLMILLGGRIAEEIIFGDSITTGAVNDIEQAYHLAESMVIRYGMSNQDCSVVVPSHSEKSKEIVDNEINQHIKKATERAYEILITGQTFLNKTANLLQKQKIIRREELLTLLKENFDII
jgi:cell division protease FtsH